MWTSLRATLVTLVLTGVLYPLAVTATAQLVFPGRANGSIVADDRGREVGSELIAQGFTNPGYLWSRPSATGYDAANSGGTNLATTSKKLRDDVARFAADYRTANGLAPGAEVPADAVARSASGLDPHVSPANALLQAARIAKARGVDAGRVKTVIDHYVEDRDLGILGEERVNVLAVNLALDRTFGRPPATMPK
jgi:K+-transporting ATPase ATPase C chain